MFATAGDETNGSVLLFKSRMKAPVMPSSVMLLASSFLAPICTRAVPKFLMPSSFANCGFLSGSTYSHMHPMREIRVLIE